MSQNMDALRLAHDVNVRRGEIRRSLRAQETTMANHITESCLRNNRVRQVLGWQPRWGPDRVAKAMAAIGGYNPTCGQLTPRQIAVLMLECGLPPARAREGS